MSIQNERTVIPLTNKSCHDANFLHYWWHRRFLIMTTYNATWGWQSLHHDDSLFTAHIDVLVQERCNSITNALELHLPCTNPFIYRVTSAHTMYSWWNRFLSSRRTRFVNPHYNMVGVAVAMVISTMHEKSCIDSHNARKFEKKCQNSVIHTSRNHNDESAEVSQSWIS